MEDESLHNNNELRPSNVEIIETKNAIIRMILSWHVHIGKLHFDWKNTKEEVGDSSCLCFEYVFHYFDIYHLQSFFENLKQNAQYSELFNISNIKYLYVVDTPSGIDFNKIIDKAQIKIFLKATTNILFSSTTMFLLMKKLKRREFLKASMYATATIFGIQRATTAPKNAILKFLGILEDKPWDEETFLLFFRNLLMVEKINYIAEEHFKRTGTKAKIAFPVGEAHKFLVALFDIPSEERIQLIIDIFLQLKDKINKLEFEEMSLVLFSIPFFKRNDNGENYGHLVLPAQEQFDKFLHRNEIK